MNPQAPFQRAAVVGVTGSGKTTLAEALAARLGVPHGEMDALNWQRGWQPIERAEFRRRVDAATAAPGWVTDGNYREVRDLVWGRAQALIWLDFPLWVNLWRLLQRSLHRLITREELWNGNREKPIWHMLRRDPEENILRWQAQTRDTWRERMPSVRADYPCLTVLRFGRPVEVERWLRAVPSSD